MMFLMAYLYGRDPHVARAMAMVEPMPLEQVPDGSLAYIARNQGAWANVYNYFAELDRVLYGGRLPYWLCHKDPLDFFSYYDPNAGEEP